MRTVADQEKPGRADAPTMWRGPLALAGLVVLVAALVSPAAAAAPVDTVGLVDPRTAEWTLTDDRGTVWNFYYGIPGDIPLVGDWDCDGDDTPAMFRPTSGFVYLRNTASTGPADLEFYFGIAGDIPVAGDWDDDGCDTLGVYRDGRLYIRNSLGTGFADHSFDFGIQGDTPFTGDFDGTAGSTLGLFRESAGRAYLRQSLTSGVADLDFYYGIPGDRVVAGDWDGDGDDTVGIYRSAAGRFYLSTENTQAFADVVGAFGGGDLLPVAGRFVRPAELQWDPVTFDHVYDVGPGHPYADPNDVPWESLAPSSLVRIHYRAEPYRTKFVINTVGTAADPVVVTGVADAQGRLPRVQGDGATTRTQLNYWNEVRSIIKVGGSNLPSDDLTPAHVYIEQLEVAYARPEWSFLDDTGASQTYSNNAACIHVERGTAVTIRGNEIHDCGNGIFTGFGSSEVVISSNHIWGNGIAGRFYEHNTYTESDGIEFEFNRYGPLCDGCLGNNLKDRSAGTVIRYNWIEGGNRQLDLVETSHTELRDDPAYRTTLVYGNVLIEPDGAGNSQVIHYGGDGGNTAMYRAGTLEMYHNTVVSTRSGNTTLLRLSTNVEEADVRNNIVHTTAGPGRLAISNQAGHVELRNNWLRAGWVDSHGSLSGSVTDLGNQAGTDPGFAELASQDLQLIAASPARNAAGPLNSAGHAHPVVRSYTRHLASLPRLAGTSIGAYE